MAKDVVSIRRSIARLFTPAIVPLALVVAPQCALAQFEEGRGLNLQSALKSTLDENAARPQLELGSSTVPRFDAGDSAARSRRLDLSLLPPGRSAIGPAFGLTNAEVNSPNTLASGTPSTTMDLGVHWRYITDGNNRVDVRAWRRTTQPDAAPLVPQDASYGARVEMQVAAPKSLLIAEKGFVGFQLEGNARLTFRRTHGVPMLYYRAGF